MCAQRKEGNETTGFACMKLRLSTIYQNFRKIRLESKWYTTFWAFYRKISGNKKTSENVVLFFRTEYSYILLNQIWNSCSISSKPSLKPGSGLRGRFLENGTDLYRDGKRDSGTKILRTVCGPTGLPVYSPPVCTRPIITSHWRFALASTMQKTNPSAWGAGCSGWCITRALRRLQLFRERLSEKMCMRQSRKVIWDMIDATLFLSVGTRKHIFMAFRANSFKFLWRTVNSKPPTMPFRIVACTFSDNLSRNSCIFGTANKMVSCLLLKLHKPPLGRCYICQNPLLF